VEVLLYEFLTSALDGGEWSASRPGRLTPRERAPGTYWIGGWVGPTIPLSCIYIYKLKLKSVCLLALSLPLCYVL
jgi:hypothetical protein